MLYTDVKDFSDLFAQAVPSVPSRDHDKPFGPWQHSEGCEIGSWLHVRDGKGLEVEPFAALLDYVRENMLQIEHDRFYWEIVHQQKGNLQDGFVRTGEARLFCKYGQIIGSRVICRVDPKTIPFQGE